MWTRHGPSVGRSQQVYDEILELFESLDNEQTRLRLRPAEGEDRWCSDPIAPVGKHTPAPRYTYDAREARVEGTVLLEVVVDRTGTTGAVRVFRGLPWNLHLAAVESVREWRFEPALCDGKPMAVRLPVTVEFSLP